MKITYNGESLTPITHLPDGRMAPVESCRLLLCTDEQLALGDPFMARDEIVLDKAITAIFDGAYSGARVSVEHDYLGMEMDGNCHPVRKDD
jgi:hypothetical protein